MRVVKQWIVIAVVMSVIAALDGGWLASWAALVPVKVWHGQLWRLVSWPLVQHGPIAIAMTCAAIYKFGGELTTYWGERRLRRFVAQLVIGASLVTCIAASLVGAGELHRLGGWAMTDLLLIAWARQYPDRALVLYGLVTLRGRDLVRITLGVVVLFAVFYGPIAMMPELAACAAAATYPRGWLRRA